MIGSCRAPVVVGGAGLTLGIEHDVLAETLMLVLSPLTVGLAVVAPEFVLGVLGQKWAPIVPALQILSLYATVRAIVPLFSQVLLMKGAQRVATSISIFLTVVMPPVFWIGSHWGITGIALGWVAVYPLVAVTLLRRVLQEIGMQKRAFAREVVLPAATACLVMAGAVEGIRQLLPASWPILARLAIEVAVGAATYPAALFAFHRPRMRELIRSLRALRAPAPA